ncbi:hypothetical protein LCGC14_2946170 [marine sediment metagenome]|uniref:Uncharacterized protein n=1 Tax=marine sediment metagenome TaxID=412755 RepID=A0A0F8XH48_9ZZZZ
MGKATNSLKKPQRKKPKFRKQNFSVKLTRTQVLVRLKGLPSGQQKSVVCALMGHSRIVTTCFGYVYCGRCEAQVGDMLAGVFCGAQEAVIVGHDCATCRSNYKVLAWYDKFLVKNPFTKRERGQ